MFLVHLGAIVLGSTLGGLGLAAMLLNYKKNCMELRIFPISCIVAVGGISYAFAGAFAMFFK